MVVVKRVGDVRSVDVIQFDLESVALDTVVVDDIEVVNGAVGLTGAAGDAA